ncbi:MAG: SDR family NAD(P)-dependent oxidoreductase, partial [Muribaculaceae bacterium]|nr:SDR family NAD(P)-dependent oxidoreductase [Muribaculaceae bacterium]
MKPIAMITGATSGIGLACAERFLKAGYRVVVTGRNVARLNELKDSYRDDLYPLIFDVRDRETAAMAIKSLPPTWQDIEVLVN